MLNLIELRFFEGLTFQSQISKVSVWELDDCKMSRSEKQSTMDDDDGLIAVHKDDMVCNFISNAWVEPATRKYLPVTNPATGSLVALVAESDATDVDAAVQAAAVAQISWSRRTLKARADVLTAFHALVTAQLESLAAGIVEENGKNIVEARAELAKGLETLEYAASVAVAATAAGKTQVVSSGPITCQDVRTPLGVVVTIVPFNFPFMVPMWTVPLALVLGNTVVLKPSEKVPLTLYRCMDLWRQAGLPTGCLNLIQGTKSAVEALLVHPTVQAVTFVGSSPVAEAVSRQCRARHVRCTALGGAKNHLVAHLPDCEIKSAASDIVVSFAGCAGQRCMAASVLLLVGTTGDHHHLSSASRLLLEQIVALAGAISAGTGAGQMGPVIDKASYDKILSYIALAEQDGAKLLLDGRSWTSKSPNGNNGDGGHWIGPTVILHSSSTDRTMCEEVFGPVLSVYQCQSWQEAVDIENASPFGNAAAIYTSSGGVAEWFLSRFKAAMLGCNIGIPVPREPFSFGGKYGTRSKYGDMDITGDGGLEFFTHRVKISSKWPTVVPDTMAAAAPASTAAAAAVTTANGAGHHDSAIDKASFAGSM
jgi:malonate-semialdehyde dehydrogenase (acetylating) / methylmalonate-semialdehyde dehydrogenase